MKKKEIKQLNQEDLKKKRNDLKKELMKLNAQRNSGTAPENPGNIKKIKRTIARINTFSRIEKLKGGKV